jgi:tetratricopeptide (TPR) repeat protein
MGLADAAMRLSKGADPATESLFVICRARALADNGRFTEARKEADRARELAARGEPRDMTGWVLLWGAPKATVDSHTAKIHDTLGDHAAAEAHYAQARRRYSPTEHQRIAALSAAAEGHTQIRQGQIERACTTWTAALDAMTGIRSSRTRKAVKSMRTDLAQFRARSARPALELDERARLWLQQAV